MKDKIYFENLDGLRGWSVMMVLFSHASGGYIWGWIGVQIFFIISGFLITTILLNSKDNKNYFYNFYGRRILRIFPIYYLLLVIIGGISIFHINFSEIIYYFLYIQNYFIGTIGGVHLLGHTWTLAIEEQFYILWPVIVYLLRKKWLILVSILGIIFSLFYRELFANSGDILTGTYSTFSNIDKLLLGCLIAILYNNGFSMKKLFPYAIIIGIGLILLQKIISSIILNEASAYGVTWSESMIYIFVGSGVIFHSILFMKNKYIDIFMKNKRILFLGKISYGMYIYHIPIYYLIMKMEVFLGDTIGISSISDFTTEIGFLRYLPLYIADICIKVGLTIIVGHLSYKYIEQRLLGYKIYFKN